LVACTTSAPRDQEPQYRSWLEFGAAVQSYAVPELDRAYTRALSQHQTAPSAASAVRLAILTASPNNASQDLERAIALLDTADRSATAGDDISQFARFYRPVLTQLLDTRESLDRAAARSAELQSQLDALKLLEEQLNAVAPAR
jgi:hypothetical protein